MEFRVPGRGDKSQEDRIDGEGKAVPEDVRIFGLMEFVDILFEYICQRFYLLTYMMDKRIFLIVTL